jgi:diguanylate cyclase (GGDEF)-like protein
MRPIASSPSQTISKLLSHSRLALGVLVVLTVVLVLWQRYGMERVVEVTGRVGLVYVDDDRSSGGASQARLELTDKETVLHCNLARQFSWPYCSVFFELHGGGIDLSRFSHMTLNMSSEGGPSQLRLRLVNFEDGYTLHNDWRTFKPNEVTGLQIGPDGRVNVPLKWVSVAQWWKDQYKPPLEHSFTNLDRVVRIEVVTPVEMQPGPMAFRIKSIQMHGKWISEKHLLIGLVAAWMVFSITWPVLAAVAMGSELNESKTKLALLSQINRALELEAIELAGQAHTDALTGALNRQGLRDALMRTSLLMSPPMSIIFTDIDHFKRINDTHGHEVGDEVLRLFAQRLRSDIRSTDKLVRWGGEEFLILCQSTDVAQAMALAEKLREALKRQPWPKQIPVTASFGVAQHRTSEEIGAVIRRADEQLYQAKSSGRDRVHAAA